MEEYLLLIDGSSLLTTQFFGNLPREILFAKTQEEKEAWYHKIMMTSKGVYTNAVFGFLRYLLKILKENQPTYLAVAWDLTRDTFRRELYEDYKGNRNETMEPLKEQFALCQDVLAQMGVVQLMDRRFEADDFCGSAAKKFENTVPVRILTKDNDYLQLVTPRTNLWLMHSTPEKTEELFQKYHIRKEEMTLPDRVFPFDPELVEKEFGIPPCHVNSLKGLMGDSSDNIKGVPGVGSATAVKLIQEYGTIAKLYEAIDHLDAAGEKAIKAYWKEKLDLKRSPLSYLKKESDAELVGRKAAFLSEQLATIKTDIELPYTLEQLRTNIDYGKTKQQLERLEFKSIQLDYAEEPQKSPLEDISIQTVDDLNSFFACMKKLSQCAAVGLALGAEGDQLYGMAAAAGKEAYYFPNQLFMTQELLVKEACSLLQACEQVYVPDAKSMLHILQIEPCPNIKDISIAAYLLDPLSGSYEIEGLAGAHRVGQIKTYQEVFGKTQPAMAAMMSEYSAYICRKAAAALLLGPSMEQELERKGMKPLYEEIEMPVVFDLYRMEADGIRVLQEALKQYGQELGDGITALQQEIWQLAGESFNILSPKQLGELLFGKMGLPGGKKTKSGYSTAAEVLERLAPEYPIVEKILTYRQLTKLKSTYADGLGACIGDDGRIHGTFNQTITATGRISSTEPNLQNIPVRMEMGRRIRKVFVPAEGCIFVDADYSQIELRILAHLSEDPGLIEAYQSAQDIHAITASQVFHIPLEKVTALHRRNAKAVNFGIVYGISAFGLSEDLSISRKEAMDYIDSYFETYPGVKKFLDRMVEEGKEQEYVSTMFGRRRPIPELKSANYMQRQFGERIAMNSPIQGTAADIMKIAMTRVNRRLRNDGLSARIVLQVHDELLLEVPLEECEQVKALLVQEMQAAAKLRVPLEVSLSTGNTWYEAK